MKTSYLRSLFVAVTVCSLPFASRAADPPKMGTEAPDFVLKTLDNQPVCLSDLTPDGKVVLVVLRGWPGYQCPLCTKQVHDFVTSAPSFAQAKTKVIMVYPGPARDLKAHAQEFLKNKAWPKDFIFVIDPDFSMVTDYGLRWDAPNETAYPSTFILDQKGMVRFAKISHSHDDRSKAADVVDQLSRMSAK